MRDFFRTIGGRRRRSRHRSVPVKTLRRWKLA